MISIALLAFSLSAIGITIAGFISSELRYSSYSYKADVLFVGFMGFLASFLISLIILVVTFAVVLLPAGEDGYGWASEPTTYNVVQVNSDKKGYTIWYDEDGDGSAERHKLGLDTVSIVEGNSPTVTVTIKINELTGLAKTEAVLALPPSQSIISTGDEE